MYFTLTQLQYLMLALFGGLLLVLLLVVGYWSYRLTLKQQAEEEADGADEDAPEAADGAMHEGHKPMPVVIVLLFAAILVWAVAYIIAVALGGINVQ